MFNAISALHNTQNCSQFGEVAYYQTDYYGSSLGSLFSFGLAMTAGALGNVLAKTLVTPGRVFHARHFAGLPRWWGPLAQVALAYGFFSTTYSSLFTCSEDIKTICLERVQQLENSYPNFVEEFVTNLTLQEERLLNFSHTVDPGILLHTR